MRPYIICHMLASVDGRIDCDMTEQIETGNEYYDALDCLDCPSMLMGRVTMQMHYASLDPFVPNSMMPIDKQTEFVAKHADGYCIAVDTLGSLRWPDNEFDGMPLLVITSENCPKEYHDTLTMQGISWVAVGKEKIDLSQAMKILYDKFGVRRLAVTGGGHINGAFLEAGLLDEISFMLAPGIDGRENMPAVFDGIKDKDRPATKLKLSSVKQFSGGTLWMRYTIEKNSL